MTLRKDLQRDTGTQHQPDAAKTDTIQRCAEMKTLRYTNNRGNIRNVLSTLIVGASVDQSTAMDLSGTVVATPLPTISILTVDFFWIDTCMYQGTDILMHRVAADATIQEDTPPLTEYAGE